MSAVDHFLETFERRRRGAASSRELAELAVHAEACPSCTLELSLMDDLAVRGAAADMDFFADERAVAMVLRQLDAPPAKPRRWGWTLTASTLLLAGAAAAAGGVLLQRGQSSDSNATQLPLSTAPKTQTGQVPGVTPAGEAESPVTPVEPSSPPVATPAAASPAEADKAASAEVESASQLFARANQLRRQGKDALASDAYRELERRFAGSAEARQAMVTLGWLLLDRSRPGEALSQFELYLKGGGAGSEDALAGLALAQQRLGKRVEERRTLETLVSRYPASANAARAKKRLAELK